MFSARLPWFLDRAPWTGSCSFSGLTNRLCWSVKYPFLFLLLIKSSGRPSRGDTVGACFSLLPLSISCRSQFLFQFFFHVQCTFRPCSKLLSHAQAQRQSSLPYFLKRYARSSVLAVILRSWFEPIFFCVDRCREMPIKFLSHRIKRLEDSWFKLLFCDDFSNTSIKCLVKYLWGYKLFFESIFIVDLARSLASTVPYFRCGS
jgi:hypothetical protein